uniref:Coiled-coil domain containing 180 n=1 Tax=Terrapene triunguis TaxID=2587831 RepID=A0A674K6X3_9SAUR
MVLVGAVRVVPSGKVYRQIFDDEVNLVCSLEEVRNKAEQHKFPMNSGRIPVVRDLEMCAGKGLLSHRQQKWVEGMPNDDFTENPVLYREITFRKAQESEDVIAAREEMEPFILESGKLLLTKLSESDRAIELLFKKIESDTDLEAFSITSFGELWDAISQESLYRRQWIKEMDETLIKLEVARAEKVTVKFLYALCCPLFLFVSSNTQMINQAVLANQRAIAKLFVNLMEADLKRELSQWLKWQERLKDWKTIQKDYVVRSFRSILLQQIIFLVGLKLNDKTPFLLVQTWRRALCSSKACLSHQQKLVQYKILHHLFCLSNILRPNKLLSLKVCTEKEAETVVNPDFFKMVGRLQSQFEQELEQMDRDFEDLAKHIEQDCKDLYKYFQQAIVLWDEHQLKLSQQENELQVKLNECRRKHENLNQVQSKIREANLDIILDKLRTQSSEGNNLVFDRYEAFHQDIVKIVASYPEAILKELISYSSSIGQYFVFVEDSEVEHMAEMTGDSLLQETEETEPQAESFPQGSTEAEQQVESLTNKTEETNTVENEESSVQETEEAEKPGDGESTAQESEETEHLEDSAESEANRFEDGDSPAQENLISVESDSSELVFFFFTEIFEEFFCKMKSFVSHTHACALSPKAMGLLFNHRIRLCFFEHLEKWFAQSLSNSWIIVTAKKEELNSELQLRLHMHQPRRECIEKDIHNVRAAELLLHQERLECHCAGVVEALNKEKNEFMKLREDQNDISKNFRRRIQDMEAIFLSSTKAEKLVALSNSLHSELLNHVEVIQISLRSYRNYLEEALGKLRDSNVDFLKACRLFSEGGNFSPEEVEFFCKRLEKETGRIDFIEGLIMIDMEKMESNYLEQATEVINKFETKFHNLAMDRLFMEKIQRFLTNLQVKIKSEPAPPWNSITNCLFSLVISDFVFLHFQDPIPAQTEFALRGSIAAAVRSESLKEESRMVMGIDNVPLLNPINALRIGHFVKSFSLPRLYLPKEFYRKDKHQITRPEYLQETFDHCAELFGQKLLSYQSQTDDYHNSCLIEFWDQLKLFEEQLPQVSHLVIDSLLKEHEQQLRHSTDQIRQLFKEQLEEWDNAKVWFMGMLEYLRYKVSACAAECAQKFVSALASLTENLLLELDESITVDDVQVAKIEMPKEKISTLIRRKRAGLSLEIHDVKPLTERGSRTWPGIPKTTLTDVPDHILCRETASVTTAKTTLGHVSAEEARDAAYVVFLMGIKDQRCWASSGSDFISTIILYGEYKIYIYYGRGSKTIKRCQFYICSNDNEALASKHSCEVGMVYA